MVLTKFRAAFQISWVASIEKGENTAIQDGKNRISKRNQTKDMKTYVKHMENEIEDMMKMKKVTVNTKSKGLKFI